MSFKGGGFQSVPQDPNLQTELLRNVQPGQELTATVSGNGSLPREDQGQPSGGGAVAQDAVPTGPGGGIGNPINTPDPLSKYKWWILLVMFLGLATVAGFLLRRPAGAAAAAGGATVPVPAAAPRSAPRAQRAAPPGPAPAVQAFSTPAAVAVNHGSHNATLLAVLKEEMFSIESEKLSGVLSPNEYKEQKAALETVLKRALKKQGT
jgi:hypothetical protein